MDHQSPIPEFRSDSYLPEGLHGCSDADALFRFGAGTKRRKSLALRLRRWLELARLVQAIRFLVDGSFVTTKPEPHDIDAVVLLPTDFSQLVDRGDAAALELEEILMSRQPAELFAAEDLDDWNAWVEFFSRTREVDRRRKGLVEIWL
jgi:hypothetical protein